jgi:alpha-D-xyloside xylohydrolase
MKHLFLFLASICAFCSAYAETKATPNANDYQIEIKPQGLRAVQNGKVVVISFYSPSIIRVSKYNETDESNINRKNLVVTMQPEQVSVASAENGAEIMLATAEAQVSFNKTNGRILFYDENGQSTLAEKANAWEMNPKMDGASNSYEVKQTFTLDANEAIYGLGQLQNGDLNQRGKTHWNMVQGNTTVWIPYVHSVKGYAFYWDDYSPTTFADNSAGMSFASTGLSMDYYYLGGSKTLGDRAVAQMRKLTGQSPMIPLWAYGYFQSKERYQSADETMGVVKKYRNIGVPLDCVVQDWQYWGGNNQWNAMQFLNPQFGNYQQMIDSVHNMNAKIIISFWANFGRDTEQFAHLRDMNALIKCGDTIMTDTYPSNEGVAIYDAYNADARNYIWQKVYQGLSSKGIDAYWMDSSEPDHYQGGEDREKTFDFVTGLGYTWRSVRNAFPLMHVGGIYTNHRAENGCNQKRATILTRSAFAGQQRYGANTWSGDIVASWQTLANQIPAALNFSICGIPNWNSDIGGFFNGDYAGAGDDAYNELYARWIQFGAFCTMMRSHGAGSDRAIYRFGERGALYFDNIEKYINLRYALLPYIYSTAWAVSNSGESFMRALPLAYPEDANTHSVKYDFLFGQSFLVAPVIQAGATSRQVYLPAGSNWIDFWTGTKTSGGQSVNKEVDIQTLPIYVKAGSIIPFGPKVQYSTQTPWDSLEVRIYPGADGTFTLYEDESDNYNYEQGKYTEIPFSWNEANQELTVGARVGDYTGKIQNRKFAVVLVDSQTGIGSEQSFRISKVIDYNGSPVTVGIDNNNVISTLSDAQLTLEDLYVDVDTLQLMVGAGKTLQIKARFQDGHTEIVTSKATVTNPHPEIVALRNGQLEAKSQGTVTLTASYEGVLGGVKSVDFTVSATSFPLTSEYFNPTIWSDGTFDETTRTLITGQYGFGGWLYPNGLDLSEWKYLVVKLAATQTCGASFRLYDENTYWTDCTMSDLGSKRTVAVQLDNIYKENNAGKLDPSHLYIIGFWSYGGCPIKIDNVYVTNNDNLDPPSAIHPVFAEDEPAEIDVYSITGIKIRSQVKRESATQGLPNGVYITGKNKVIVTNQSK